MSDYEFLPNETLEEWIQRQVKRFPDPWAGVQKFHEEVKARSRERKLQRWVDEHRVK